MEINTGANSTYKKLAVQCSAETFVVHGNLVLRNYIHANMMIPDKLTPYSGKLTPLV